MSAFSTPSIALPSTSSSSEKKSWRLERTIADLLDVGYTASDPIVATLEADLEKAKLEEAQASLKAANRKETILELLTEAGEEVGHSIVKEYLKTIGYGTRRLPVRPPCPDFPPVYHDFLNLCSCCKMPSTYQVEPNGEKLYDQHIPIGIRRCRIVIPTATPTGTGSAVSSPIGPQVIPLPTIGFFGSK